MQSTIEIEGFRTLLTEPSARSRALVVMLHGYAMLPDDLSPFASSMRTDCTFYCPQGPESIRPHGCAWWPIDQERRQAQIQAGPRDLYEEYPLARPAIRQRLLQLVISIRARHPPLPLVLAGFSQGGMLACDLALHMPLNLSGLALLSSSRIAFEEWSPKLPSLRGIPTFVSHGRNDPDLAFAAGDALQSALFNAGATVTWVPFDGRHEIPLLVWRQLKRFLISISDS